MNEFTIYCTPEQTKKALELGAPIESYGAMGFIDAPIIPTAEQMIGWLEDHGINTVIVCKKDGGDYGYTVYHTSHRSPLQCFWYASRKEATLAAISAALEYLIEQKE